MWKTKQRSLICLAGVFLLAPLVGCHHRQRGQDLIPAASVLNAACQQPENESQINFLTLRQEQPENYILDKGDTLGIYIQGITGDKDVPPPVHFPEDTNMQPALGYPVPIRDDGYISLPLVKPIRVAGLTLAQAESKILQAYTRDKEILLEGNEKIIVTLMRRRTYNILVVREDVSDNRPFSVSQNDIYVEEGNQGQTFSIELPAYENDVLHALSETGGMPGEGALNEIRILRGGASRVKESGAIVHSIGDTPGAIVNSLGDTGEFQSPTLAGADVIRIPIRGPAGSFPQLAQNDIILNEGDVVFIEGRDRDVFYTGGLLDGGRFPLPRDYDIDVLEAMSMAGGNVSSSAGSGGQGGFSGIGNIMPATQVTIMRKCNGRQISIDVDLRDAGTNPNERVIIQPGDMIVLEYRPRELMINSALSVLQIGGIFNVFRN